MAAAIGVDLRGIDAQVLDEGHWHRAEGFVDFEQVDVVDLHAGLLQRALGRRDRGFQHDHRIVAQQGQVVDAGQGLDAQVLEALFRNDHHARGAVADLAGRGGGQAAVFPQQLHALDAFEAGVEANALVDRVDRDIAVGVGDLKTDDLVLEGAGLGGGNGPLVTSGRSIRRSHPWSGRTSRRPFQRP